MNATLVLFANMVFQHLFEKCPASKSRHLPFICGHNMISLLIVYVAMLRTKPSL